MLLTGSCARGTYSASSDIDLQLLVSRQFDQSQLTQLLLREFSAYGVTIRPCGLRGN